MRTSPLAESLAGAKPRWGIANGMRVPLAFERESDPTLLALVDCSFLTRTGLKGAGAEAWLRANDLRPPSGINRWADLPNGGLVGRLGTSEFFLEDGPRGSAVADVAHALGHGAPGVYPVLRQDAALALVGTGALEVLVQMCNVDFAPTTLDRRELVMTSMAGVSVLVVPTLWRETPMFRIWCDPTFGPYLYTTLLEITEELGGGPLGLARLFPDLDTTPT
jgi:sarcosine oxidase subunit gamma